MKILSLGAGVQSSTLLILAYQQQIECDGVIFADTGAEKPTTYELLPVLFDLCKEVNIPYKTVIYSGKGGWPIYDYCIRYRVMPSVIKRWCTDKFKIRPITKALDCDVDEVAVGFSFDEQHRIKQYNLPYKRIFPLIDLRLTQPDCARIIQHFGLPLPTKSSCFLCPFQSPNEWRWLKLKFPDLFEKALEVEQNYYNRRPDKRDFMGLYSGLPLWKGMGQGLQMDLGIYENFGCYSGHCFH